MKRLYMLSAIAAVSFFTTAASATVIGTMSEANCGGGGVTVSNSAITWSPNGTVAGTGCIITGIATNVTWGTSSSMGPNDIGNIKNLAVPGGGSVDQFMTFVNPANGLDFVLTALGPGSSNTGEAACAASNSNGAPNCSIGATSPFILTYDNGNTDVALAAKGTVADPSNSSQISNWGGSFTTQLPGVTPLQVYMTFCGNNPTCVPTTGSIQSSQSAAFNITFTTPEPGTIGMLFIGGALIAFARKRKLKA